MGILTGVSRPDRFSPHNKAAESGFLSAVLLAGRLPGEVADRLFVNHFFIQEHQAVYCAMRHLHDLNQPICLVGLIERLCQYPGGSVDDWKGVMVRLADTEVRTDNISFYADFIIDKSNLRDLAKFACGFCSDAHSNQYSSIELLEKIEARLSVIAREIRGSPDDPGIMPTAARLEELRSLPYADYLCTPEWRETRARAIAAARNRCRVCNAPGMLDVHHRTYERLGCELADDLLVLCRECHGLFHRKLNS